MAVKIVAEVYFEEEDGWCIMSSSTHCFVLVDFES
jgi:hypothetical protein